MVEWSPNAVTHSTNHRRTNLCVYVLRTQTIHRVFLFPYKNHFFYSFSFCASFHTKQHQQNQQQHQQPSTISLCKVHQIHGMSMQFLINLRGMMMMAFIFWCDRWKYDEIIELLLMLLLLWVEKKCNEIWCSWLHKCGCEFGCGGFEWISVTCVP